MRITVGKKIEILFLLAATTLSALSGLSKTNAGGKIEVTSQNFFIVEAGIPASEHILIVKSCHCLDNAKDKSGNEYYFYMVDMLSGLKALITASKLEPYQELDDKTKEFCKIVKIEIAKDGGIERLINKFKN